jgi:hypothetical protein
VWSFIVRCSFLFKNLFQKKTGRCYFHYQHWNPYTHGNFIPVQLLLNSERALFFAIYYPFKIVVNHYSMNLSFSTLLQSLNLIKLPIMIKTLTKWIAVSAICLGASSAFSQNPVITASQTVTCAGSGVTLSANDFLNKGLVAYYPFNGNANDYSGNSYNATAIGVTLATDRFGTTNRCYSFSGNSTYVTCPPATYFNGDYTISGWVNASTAQTWCRMIDFGNGAGSDNVLVTLNYAGFGTVGSSVYVGGTNSDVSSSQAFTLNQWVHIVVTQTGTTRYFYYNGALVGTYTGLGVPQNVVRNGCYIGLSNWSGDGEIFGSMDDIRIYDRSLSLAEVASLYAYENAGEAQTAYVWSSGGTNATEVVTPTTTTTYSVTQTRDGAASSTSSSVQIAVVIDDQTVSPANSSLICNGWATVSTGSSQTGVNYYLRENSNNSVVAGPVAGTGNALNLSTGYVSANTTYNVYAKETSGGFDFDGVDDYGVIPNSSGINSQFASNQITIEGWINPTATTGAPMILGESYQSDGTILFTVYQSGTTLIGGFFNGGWQNVTVNVTANEWQHFACTYDQVNLKFYINGNLISSAPFTSPLPAASDEWRMGRRWDFPEYFDGQLDEIRVWNVARTQSELQSAMNTCLTGTETNLVAYFTFEEGTAATTADIAGADQSISFMNTGSSNWVSGIDKCNGCALQMSTTASVTINPIAQQTVSANPASVVCSGTSVINVANTENGVNYYLRNDANDSVVSGPLSGNGSAIDFGTGTVSSSATYNVVGRTPSRGITFNGSGPLAAISPTIMTEFASNTITLEGWFKPTAVPPNSYAMLIGEMYDGDGQISFNILQSGNNVSGGFFNGGWVMTNSVPLTYNSWQHIACTYDQSTINLYINGLLVATQNATNALPVGNGNWVIGKRWDGTDYFVGSADEVRIWNVARSQTDIINNMHTCVTGAQTGLVASYNFEENTLTNSVADQAGNYNLALNTIFTPTQGADNCGCEVEMNTLSMVTVNTIADLTATAANICDSGITSVNLPSSQSGVQYWLRNNNDNSIVDGPVSGTGSAISLMSDTVTASATYNVFAARESNGLVFDGADDYVAVPDAGNIPSGNTNYTIEAWIKPTAANADGIVAWGNYGSQNEVNALRLNGAYQLHNYWWNNDLTVNTPNMLDGKWHHVAATFDGTTRSIYFDGQLMGSDNPSGLNITVTTNLKVGESVAGEFFEGAISNVRVWNIARTGTQLSTYMNLPLAGTETGLVINLELHDGMMSPVAADKAGADNNGVLMNMDIVNAWIVPCSQQMANTVTVNVNNSTSGSLTQTACDSYILNAQTYTTSGTYVQTLTNAAGCDSTLTLNLTITNSTSSSSTVTACGSYTLNSTTYTATAVYTQTVTNAAGCDSIITLDLTVNNVDVSVTANANDLTAGASSAAYVWLDCDNSYAPIAGETNQTFSATMDGNYAVSVTENGCTDTSACVNVTGTGITRPITENNLSVYPNPANSSVTVELNTASAQNAEVSLVNAAGQIVFSERVILAAGKNARNYNLQQFARGVYTVRITTKESVIIKKVVLNQ